MEERCGKGRSLSESVPSVESSWLSGTVMSLLTVSILSCCCCPCLECSDALRWQHGMRPTFKYTKSQHNQRCYPTCPAKSGLCESIRFGKLQLLDHYAYSSFPTGLVASQHPTDDSYQYFELPLTGTNACGKSADPLYLCSP